VLQSAIQQGFTCTTTCISLVVRTRFILWYGDTTIQLTGLEGRVICILLAEKPFASVDG